MWFPSRSTGRLNDVTTVYIQVVTRLKHGVTLEQAQAHLNNISRAEWRAIARRTQVGGTLVQFRSRWLGNAASLLLFLGAVAFVLLIAVQRGEP